MGPGTRTRMTKVRGEAQSRSRGASRWTVIIPSGLRVWIATGHTDMRRRMNSLVVPVQEALERDPNGADRADRARSFPMAVATRSCQPSIVHSPNRRLCAILDPDLAKDRLDMDLHCGLGDVDFPRNAFVGIAINQKAQDRFLPRRKLWCRFVSGGNEHFVVGTAWASMIRWGTFGIEHEGQQCRRKNCFTHHHQF